MSLPHFSTGGSTQRPQEGSPEASWQDLTLSLSCHACLNLEERCRQCTNPFGVKKAFCPTLKKCHSERFCCGTEVTPPQLMPLHLTSSVHLHGFTFLGIRKDWEKHPHGNMLRMDTISYPTPTNWRKSSMRHLGIWSSLTRAGVYLIKMHPWSTFFMSCSWLGWKDQGRRGLATQQHTRSSASTAGL